MKKIRLAVIGTGMAWERLHYPAIQELGDKYEIVALANRTKSDAEAFARRINLDVKNVYDDHKEMLKRDDIDAVDILVPIELNYEISRDVAKAGKNFICEKPMAPNLDAAIKFLEITKRLDLKIMIAENYRYNEENYKIKELIHSGKIGEVIYFIKNNITCFKCDMTKDTFAAKEWRQHPMFEGGAFLDAALHDIASLRYIFGEIQCVQAFGKPQREDFNPYVSVNTNILFRNNINGYYTYFPSGSEPQRPLVGFRIFGTKGEIFLEERSCGVINVAYNDGSSELIRYTPERGYYYELLNYYNALNGTEDIAVTPEVEFGDVKAVFDILDAASKRSIVYVDEPSNKEYLNYINGEQNIHPYVQ